MLSNTYTDRRTDTYGCITRPKGADGITKTCLSTYSNLEVGNWRILLIWQQCYIEIQLPFFPNLLTQEIFGNSFNNRRRRNSKSHNIPNLVGLSMTFLLASSANGGCHRGGKVPSLGCAYLLTLDSPSQRPRLNRWEPEGNKCFLIFTKKQ